jgi:predicted RNA binding protein YcfA (HicA-like mRNA interferase family)
MKALERAGFYLDRVSGSHHHYRYPDRRGTVTVALHGGTIKRKTISSIIKQAGMTVEEFLALL